MSHTAIEKSLLELRICEYDVRSIASPISATIELSRCWTTERVIGSTAAMTAPLSSRPPIFAGKQSGKLPTSAVDPQTRSARVACVQPCLADSRLA